MSEELRERLAAVKVGDTVGIKSGTGLHKKIYRLETVTKVTKAQIITASGRYWRERGSAVGGLAWIEIMTPETIKAWEKAKEEEEAERKRRAAEYDPRESDDHVQAALRSLREKARKLCEKLQAELEHGHTVRRRPTWESEFLGLVHEIEESEHALRSFGESTTLKPFNEISSLLST